MIVNLNSIDAQIEDSIRGLEQFKVKHAVDFANSQRLRLDSLSDVSDCNKMFTQRSNNCPAL